MTRDEFIAGYCGRSKVTWEWLNTWREAVPCDCGEDGCEGWAMVSKEDAPRYIWAHENDASPWAYDDRAKLA